MASPVWKIYTAQGEYVASCKDIEDAAALVTFRGDGATIRYDHKHIVWREGAEEWSAGDNYDATTQVVTQRIGEIHRKAYERVHGS